MTKENKRKLDRLTEIKAQINYLLEHTEINNDDVRLTFDIVVMLLNTTFAEKL